MSRRCCVFTIGITGDVKSVCWDQTVTAEDYQHPDLISDTVKSYKNRKRKFVFSQLLFIIILIIWKNWYTTVTSDFFFFFLPHRCLSYFSLLFPTVWRRWNTVSSSVSPLTAILTDVRKPRVTDISLLQANTTNVDLCELCTSSGSVWPLLTWLREDMNNYYADSEVITWECRGFINQV